MYGDGCEVDRLPGVIILQYKYWIIILYTWNWYNDKNKDIHLCNLSTVT